MRHGRSEQDQGTVADDPVDVAAERFGRADEAGDSLADHVAKVLGIQPLAERRRAHDVGEQRGDHLASFTRRAPPGKGRATRRTEAGIPVVRASACPTQLRVRHGVSLGAASPAAAADGVTSARMRAERGTVPGLFSLISAQEREEFERRGRVARFPRGSRLLQEGEDGDRVIVLLSGRAKVTCSSADGREVVLDFRGPGELVGDLSVIDRRPRSSSVEALEPVEALILAASDLRALISRHPGIAMGVLETLVGRFREADRKRIEFAASDTVGRVAARLVELAERYGRPEADGIEIALAISQDELAGWTAASRAGVTGALRTLRESGWVDTRRRGFTVRDLKALRARATVQNWMERAGSGG
jgi:CRP/FNR family cyclic AMP-dependent transcriptional regulator